MSASPTGGGLAASLRTLAATFAALLRTRLELLSVEVQEEKQRLAGLLFYGLAAVSLLITGCTFLAVFITVLLWDTNRLLALGVCAAVFLVLGFVALVAVLRYQRAGSKLFAASLAELSRDRDLLGP